MQATEIATEILKGADFAELAKTRSIGENAADGGDLGLIDAAPFLEMENILINNHFRVCSVRDGQNGVTLLKKSLTTKHKVDLIIFTLINRYYPGLMFLADLVQNSLYLHSILLTSMDTTVEQIKEKTNYNVSKILQKSEIPSQLVTSIKTAINHDSQTG